MVRKLAEKKLTLIRQLFIISALNHHISILSFDIHPEMLRYLARGDREAEAAWWGVKMQRSRWYDLLHPQDRLEAMKGVWAILGWMMRNTEDVDHTTGPRCLASAN